MDTKKFSIMSQGSDFVKNQNFIKLICLFFSIYQTCVKYIPYKFQLIVLVKLMIKPSLIAHCIVVKLNRGFICNDVCDELKNMLINEWPIMA